MARPTALAASMLPVPFRPARQGDRQSTRLNSSHPSISYAVHCCPARTRRHRLALHDALPICLELEARLAGRICERLDAPMEMKPGAVEGDPAHSRRLGPLGDGTPDRLGGLDVAGALQAGASRRSAEHTSELQSPVHLVCRPLLSSAHPPTPPCPTRRSSDLPRTRGPPRGPHLRAP